MAHVAPISMRERRCQPLFSPRSFMALETAMLLVTASPTKAREFALSMYQRAAWGLDVDQIEHWARIVTQLAQLTRALQAG